MATKTTASDATYSLDTSKDMAAYLNTAFEEGDLALITTAIGDIARLKGMAEIARKTGLVRESLYKTLSEDGNPAFSTVIKVLESINIRLEAKPNHDS